ncbi:Uncharacterized conserved protein YehS, DUF1456 family [Tenacibaculum sp. MAR_2009_124]|uniref:DUF1456 family protein n=1 Tax=Tenacibaculum sp. MAR_2009_124 TaxID=1250059 RepID=UPI0008980EA4|nr:DUF1456 family protein [Tenacibaculum sp. MAR_2009_124]SEC30808.1 Uncharacterized conserved protein YehS, DUF1456 family [Tenacibaculum sp. MAR_2009_124]
MENNVIIRQIRYIFDFKDSKMIELFALVEHKVTIEQVHNWMKKEDQPSYKPMQDEELAHFLNGLIIFKRGKREGPPPQAEKSLNNNLILRKLKIALNFKDFDIIDTLSLVKLNISKHELSAFFRNPKQDQYRICKDQFLRNFLFGLQKKYRPTKDKA